MLPYRNKLFITPSRMDFQPPAAQARVHQPCASCRMLRRRCDSKCLLAPYFPANEMDTFAGVHRVFGASNVIKMIQMVEETKRDDTVKAIVYEAKARLRDPVYGSAGAIFKLQKMVQEIKVELESIRARISDLQAERDHLLNINLMNYPRIDHVTPMNDLIFDDCGLSVDFSDPFEFPVEGDWRL